MVDNYDGSTTIETILLDFTLSLRQLNRSKDNCPPYRAVRFIPCPS